MQTSWMGRTWQDNAMRAMTRRGKTRADIMSALGVTKGTVSSWFSGRHPPSMSDLRKLAEMLEMSILELLDEDDCLARNAHELATLRALRDIPEEQRAQASALITAVLATLRQPPPRDD